jgi:hypothetical protein
MAIVMTKDGKVRPMEMSDFKEVAECEERICQLEQLNAVLAEQVDRMRPVVEAAQAWLVRDVERFRLAAAVDAYNTAMAQLAKEGRGDGAT